MSDIECQRRLVEVALPHLDPCGLTAQGLPSVGADRQPAAKRDVLARDDGDGAFFRDHCRRLVVHARQVGKFRGSRFQRRDQRAIVDVVAELLDADFIAVEADLGRPDQAAGVIDQSHHLQRRGTVLATPPDVEPIEQVDGRAEQGRGAIVGIGDAASEQGGSGAAIGERNCCGEAGRPAPDDDRVESHRTIIHDGNN